MLAVKATGYVSPVAEQTIGPLTLSVQIQNLGDEDAVVSGLVRIYRKSTGLLLFDSQLAITSLLHGATTTIETLTSWSPGAPAADDYFCIAEIGAASLSTSAVLTTHLGAFTFDITPAPMGPVPGTHHTTHENGGMDPIDVDGMSGLLATPQTPATHNHEPIPIFGVYVTTSPANPASALGYGTWSEIVLVPPLSTLLFWQRDA